MSLELFAAYLVACLVIMLIPGPNVTLIIASSMRYGTRAGLLNIAGGQFGLTVSIAVVGVGLASTIEAAGHWFEWIRLIGAAYLIWLGIQMFRSGAAMEKEDVPARPSSGFFLQGFLVAVSNPKTLVFFGAFFPQFIDPAGNYPLQIAAMGVATLAFAAVTDSCYAMAAGRAGRALTASRMKLLSRVGGSFLVGGGLWLAVSRVR